MTGYVGPIEKATLDNNFFRKVLFTGKYSQLVVMCLQGGPIIADKISRGLWESMQISLEDLEMQLPA